MNQHEPFNDERQYNQPYFLPNQFNGDTDYQLPVNPGEPFPEHPDRQFPGFPGGQFPGFPGGNAPGFPGGQSPGFPGGNAPGFPGGQSPGFPGGNAPGFPGGQSPGFPGGNAPGFPGGTGGQTGGAPTTPPPSFTPAQPQFQAFAVDPGAIRGCLFRFTYIWLRRDSFWFFPTFVGRNSVAGFRWSGRRWTYFGIDLNRVESFQCF